MPALQKYNIPISVTTGLQGLQTFCTIQQASTWGVSPATVTPLRAMTERYTPCKPGITAIIGCIMAASTPTGRTLKVKPLL